MEALGFESAADFAIWVATWAVILFIGMKIVVFFAMMFGWAFFMGENAGEKWRRENPTPSAPLPDHPQQTREPETSP